MANFPDIFRVRQSFPRPVVENVAATVDAELAKLALATKIKPGQSVAITAGSRGIANIAVIIKAIVEHLQGLGAKPFIVPAMGSHGGATAEGQRKIIESYGITEAFCGCPIRATMETVVVCQAAEGFAVHFDRIAYEADHVLVCGRVKPHTNFVGDIESGLMKMMLIGLGKFEGAKIYHRAIQTYSFGQILSSVGGEVLGRCSIAAGLAILENGYDETAQIVAVAPEQFETREKELLRQARAWMPRLPFKSAHLLIVDEIGKDISGSGLDSNIVGRKIHEHGPAENEWPKIKRIAIRALSKATHGNAAGVGTAEFCKTRLVQAMDATATRLNCVTSGHPASAMVPLDFETDREIIETALSTAGLAEPAEAKLMWIHNTLDLAEVECSANYLQEAQTRDDLEILTDPRPLPLDRQGDLPDFVDYC